MLLLFQKGHDTGMAVFLTALQNFGLRLHDQIEAILARQ